MFEIYFFDAQGRCNAPIYSPDGRVAIEILATYMKFVPSVLVTRHGACAFESSAGVVVWPDDLDERAVDVLCREFPEPVVGASTCADLLADYQDAFANVIVADASRLPLAIATLRALEVPLLACAAAEGIDLLQRGYIPSANAQRGRDHWHLASAQAR